MLFKTKRRKIQQTGHSYWITLPAVWTESMALQKGDFVYVEIQDDGVLLVKKHEKIE